MLIAVITKAHDPPSKDPEVYKGFIRRMCGFSRPDTQEYPDWGTLHNKRSSGEPSKPKAAKDAVLEF